MPTAALERDAATIQAEHEDLRTVFNDLETKLSKLSADESPDELLQRVLEEGKLLSGWLPIHFAHEEQGILAHATALGDKEAEFAAEMKRQHLDLNIKLQEFRSIVAGVETAEDVRPLIRDLREQGLGLILFLRTHLETEHERFETLVS